MSPSPTRTRDAMPDLTYPPGTLAYDPDEDRVRCHLCGRWFKAIAPGHLLHKHQLDADAYRALAGLNLRHPLSVPSLSALRARQLRRRMRNDERIKAGMKKGTELARNGRLQDQARKASASRPRSIERQAELQRSGRRVGETRAATHRAARERAARALGYPDLDAYLRHRYVDDGARIADLQAELGASYPAVRGDLGRAGIPVQHGRRTLARST